MGVGFAIKTGLLGQLPSFLTGINERLMKLCLPISSKRFITIISAYVPTLISTDTKEVKEQFYADLDVLLRSTPASDKVLVLRDFNARVGKDSNQWKGLIGKHGIGKMKVNGLLVLSKCAEYDLVLTKTTFRQADKRKETLCTSGSNSGISSITHHTPTRQQGCLRRGNKRHRLLDRSPTFFVQSLTSS